MAPLLPILIPLITLFGLLAITLIKVYKEAHKARDKFDDLTKAAKESANALSNIKEEAENVNNALDSLESKTDALKDLTMGTSEWASAVSDVNKEVRDLIDSQNDLYDKNISPDISQLIEGEDYYRDSAGILHLTEDGEEKVRKNQISAVKAAQAANDAAQKAAEDAEYASIKESILANRYNTPEQEHNIFNKNTIDWINKVFGTELGYGKTKTTPLDSKIDENILDIVTNGLQSKLINVDELSSISKLKDLGLTEEQAELITSNKNLQESIENLATITQQNTEKQEQRVEDNLLKNEAVYNNLYGENSKVDETLRSGVLSTLAEDIVKIANDKTYSKEVIEENKDNFAKAQGWKKDDSGKYVDIDGNIQEVTDEGVKNYLALAEAEEEAVAKLNDYNKAAEESKNNWESAEKIEKPFKNYLTLLEREKVLKEKGSARNKEEEKEFSQIQQNKEKALQEVQKELHGLLDLSKEAGEKILTPDFIEKNALLIEKAINGDATALQELQLIAAKDIIVNFDFNTQEDKEKALAALAEIENILPEIKVGTSLEDSGIKQQLVDILLATGATADQMAELLSLTGFEGAKVEFKEVTLRGATSRLILSIVGV